MFHKGTDGHKAWDRAGVKIDETARRILRSEKGTLSQESLWEALQFDPGTLLENQDLPGALLENQDLTDAQVSSAPECTTVLMVDDRDFGDDDYHAKDIVLNSAYAERQGYHFSLVKVGLKGKYAGMSPEWAKPLYVSRLLQEPADCERSWVLLLDSDAYVTDENLAVADMLRQMKVDAETTSVVLSREEPVAEFTEATGSGVQRLNTGVLFFQRSESTRAFFDEWLAYASANPEKCPASKWPFEQACLEHMLLDDEKDRWAGLVQLVPMTEVNSPWGRMIKHQWNGKPFDNFTGRERRQRMYDEELEARGITAETYRAARAELSNFRTTVVLDG